MGFFIIRLLRVYMVLILIRVVMSWMRPNPNNPFVQVVTNLTEPVLAPVRRIVPPIGGTIDISPMIVFLLFYLITAFMF